MEGKKVKDGNPLVPYAASLVPMSIKKLNLPTGVGFSYGCRGCEWKGTAMCPEGYAWDSAEVTTGGVCQERAIYLKGFYRGEKDDPTFTEWEADYNQGVAQKQLQQMLDRSERLREQLEQVEKRAAEMETEGTPPDDENLKKHRKEAANLRKSHAAEQERWFLLWKSIRNLQETRLTREAPKKVEVTHRKDITIDEFNRMMRDANNTIDADYELLEEEEENDADR